MRRTLGIRYMQRSRLFLLMMVVGVATSACGRAPSAERPDVDTTDTRSKLLLELAREVPQITQFRRALERTSYRELLETTGPFTVLAPMDRAFLNYIRRDSAMVADLADTLETVVGMHLVRGDLNFVWSDSLLVSTVAEETIVLRRSGNRLTVQGNPILARHIARNGILYVISDGLEPTPPDTSQGSLEERMAPVET